MRLGHCSFPHSQHGPPFCTTHNTSPSAFQCDSQAVCCRITLVEPRKLVSRCQVLSATHSAVYVPFERAKNDSIQEFENTSHEATLRNSQRSFVSRTPGLAAIDVAIRNRHLCSQQPQHLSRIPQLYFSIVSLPVVLPIRL